jgi:WD40 repeat protein
VRPLTGSQDIDRLREKEDAAARAARDERKKERQRQGTRGAWCVSADGSLLAAGTPDCHVEVWRADGTAPIAVLKGHTDLVCDVAFTSGGKTVYACADDGTVRGWKVESGEQVAHLGKPYETSEFSGGRLPRGYQQIESSADGRYLVLAGALRVSVWDAQGKGWTDVPPALPYARHLRFGGDPRHVVIAAHDRLARFDLQAAPTRSTSFTDPKKEYVWLEPSWQRQRPVLSGTSELPDDLGAGPLADVVVLDLPSLVVTLHSVGFLEKDEKPRLRAWDLRTGERRWEVEAPSGRLMPAPKTAVLALADRGVLRILAPGDGKVVMTVKIPSGREVRALAPDASAWYDAEKDGTLVRVPIVGDATGGK